MFFRPGDAEKFFLSANFTPCRMQYAGLKMTPDGCWKLPSASYTQTPGMAEFLAYLAFC